jgi:hypothetical protein
LVETLSVLDDAGAFVQDRSEELLDVLLAHPRRARDLRWGLTRAQEPLDLARRKLRLALDAGRHARIRLGLIAPPIDGFLQHVEQPLVDRHDMGSLPALGLVAQDELVEVFRRADDA